MTETVGLSALSSHTVLHKVLSFFVPAAPKPKPFLDPEKPTFPNILVTLRTQVPNDHILSQILTY